jgi:hypothetical protein
VRRFPARHQIFAQSADLSRAFYLVQKFDWMLVGTIHAVRVGFIMYPRNYTPFSVGLERVRGAHVVWVISAAHGLSVSERIELRRRDFEQTPSGIQVKNPTASGQFLPLHSTTIMREQLFACEGSDPQVILALGLSAVRAPALTHPSSS